MEKGVKNKGGDDAFRKLETSFSGDKDGTVCAHLDLLAGLEAQELVGGNGHNGDRFLIHLVGHD